MPRLSTNPTQEQFRGEEYDIGTLPIGSGFVMMCAFTGEPSIGGYVFEQWIGVTVVVLTKDWDANYGGTYESGTLYRSSELGRTYMQKETPVIWLGVDDDVRGCLVTALEAASQVVTNGCLANKPVSCISLLPVISPIPMEGECDDNDNSE